MHVLMDGNVKIRASCFHIGRKTPRRIHRCNQKKSIATIMDMKHEGRRQLVSSEFFNINAKPTFKTYLLPDAVWTFLYWAISVFVFCILSSLPYTFLCTLPELL